MQAGTVTLAGSKLPEFPASPPTPAGMTVMMLHAITLNLNHDLLLDSEFACSTSVRT
ncbi:MAG TPA: hypothetical protein VNW52_13190 [Burkholderiaceae bacterium]|nr:hypothetical protein [Burkholderiaceae bacterium]